MSESIYNEIRSAFQEFNELPYQFQLLPMAGKEEVDYMLWSEEILSNEDKERLSIAALNKMKELIDNDKTEINLLMYLRENPLHEYLYAFTDLLRAYIEEEFFQTDEIYNFGIKLATQSIYDDMVKLGIIILGNFENDYTKRVLLTLGYHSEFTLYVLEAISRFSNFNHIAFDLLQNTDGYGRLCSLIKFKPVKEEQKKLLVEEIVESTTCVKRDCSLFIVTNTLLEDYIDNIIIDSNNFTRISYLLAYSSFEANFKMFKVSKHLIEKYLFSAYKYAKSYIDFAAIAIIKSNIATDWRDSVEADERENGWSMSIEKSMERNCEDLIRKFDYESIITEELINNNSFEVEDASMMLYLLKELQFSYDYTVDSRIFEMMFSRMPFYFDMIEYFLINNENTYYKDIYNFIIDMVPEEVFTESRNMDDPSVKYLPDVWIVYLLQAFKNARDYNEGFFIRCLFARFKDVRIKAATVLKYFREDWSDKVVIALKDMIKDEPDKDLVKYIQKMLIKFKFFNIEDIDSSTKELTGSNSSKLSIDDVDIVNLTEDGNVIGVEIDDKGKILELKNRGKNKEGKNKENISDYEKEDNKEKSTEDKNTKENIKKNPKNTRHIADGETILLKKQRYVDVFTDFEISNDDIRILLSNLKGVEDRDLSVVEGSMKKGDILYLKADPNDIYEKNTVLLCSSNGYVVGYISKVHGEVLYPLLKDRSSKIYAILKDDINAYKPRVDIYLHV
ncbi:MAG: HIRAN domain-containing protein [Peptostreptococcus sp.]|uniref:HIRAN domain-containing protein n=1 Tax=Peptostreptococcus sp. TaxID=1262 RepID=UPI002FC6B970